MSPAVYELRAWTEKTLNYYYHEAKLQITYPTNIWLIIGDLSKQLFLSIRPLEIARVCAMRVEIAVVFKQILSKNIVSSDGELEAILLTDVAAITV